jgi:hypothetical protein
MGQLFTPIVTEVDALLEAKLIPVKVNAVLPPEGQSKVALPGIHNWE